MSNPNDMAFPVHDVEQTPNGTFQLGLTKREYVATELMACVLANGSAASEDLLPKLYAASASIAVAAADALLTELAK